MANTQFEKTNPILNGRIGIISCLKGAYDEKSALLDTKNKANIMVLSAAFSVRSHGFVIPVETGIQSFGWLWIPHQVRNDRLEAVFKRNRLKKQSQFADGQNELKVNYNKEI